MFGRIWWWGTKNSRSFSIFYIVPEKPESDGTWRDAEIKFLGRALQVCPPQVEDDLIQQH